MIAKTVKIREGLQMDYSEMSEYQKKLLGWSGEGFDLRTHIVDPQTNQLLKFQPYRRVVSREEGTYYVRKDEHGVERRYSEKGLPLEAQVIAIQTAVEPKAKHDPKRA